MPLELQRSFRLYVTHVDGEGQLLKICGQLDQPSSFIVESLFQTAREDLEQGIGSVPPGAIHDGIICAAKYKDGAYYRAKIMSTKNLSNGFVGVYFIDFGNKDVIPLNAIRFLDNYDPMFLRLPSLVNEYYLARFMHPSGRWEGPLLLMLQNLLCYAEHPVTVEGLTHTLPIISLQLQGTDLTSHLISKRLGVAVPVPKQRMMLAHPGGDILQAANWQQNFMVESPSYTEHVRFLVNQNLSPNPASAPCLQQTVPFSGATAALPSDIVQRLQVNKSARDMASLRGPIRQLRENNNFPPILEGTPTLTAPDANKDGLSPKKSASYNSHMLECNSEHKVFVSFVEDGPELFTVQLMADIKRFQNMMDDINRRPHTSLTEPPMIGTVCLGRISEDRIICRSIVMNLSGSQCKLYFVDLGDTEMVSYYDVFDIPEEFVKPDVFALRFCLSGVKKMEKSPYLNEVFKKLVSGKVMKLRVVAPEGPPLIQYGELYLGNKNVLDLLLANMKDKLKFKRMDMLQLGSQHSVLVSYVDSCLKFYVQLSDQINDLNIVMDAVKAHCESTSSPGELPVGAACCARFADDGHWYRACVCSIKDNKVVVAYVDYGNEQEVAVSDLRTITPDLIKLPAQALKCALKGFENHPIETKTSEQLEKLVLEKTLIANIVAVVSGDTMLVTLTDDTVFPPLDVAREIKYLLQPKINREMDVTAPVAKRAPEPYRPPEGGTRDAAHRKTSFTDERRHDLPEELGQRAGCWRNRNRGSFERNEHSLHREKSEDRPDHRRGDRESRGPFERTEHSLHRDKSEDRTDYRRGDRRGKPWEPGAPIDDWRKELEPRRAVRGNRRKLKPDQHEKSVPKPGWKHKESSGVGKRLRAAAEAASADAQKAKGSIQDRLKRDDKSNKQDEWEEKKPEERSGGARFERRPPCELGADRKEFPRREFRERGDRPRGGGGGGGFTPRERAAADRSFGSDKSGGGGKERAGRAPPHKPRGPFTHAQYRELAEPVPLDTPFAEPAVEPGAQHEVAVTWIVSPQSFYTQILAQQPQFLEMMHRIPELYKGVRSYCGPVGVGASVLARYPADGVLYRATVVAVQPLSKFVVQYVDFGNKQLVDAKDIWQLERQLMELPRMAVHCRLLGVAPPAAEWKADPEVDLCFNAPRYQCVFAESADGQQRVSLWSGGASVADALVAKGLAVHADPPPAVTLKDEAVDLTIIVGQQMPCRVTHVQSFDKFYVQLDLEKAALVEQAVAACDAALLTPLAPASLADGVHCTVRHEGRVFRAILSDTADAARVAAVLPDYGRTITTSLDHLMVLPTELSVYYYQSLECCLNNYSAESRRLLSEDGLRARLVDHKFIVYVDSVEGISLLTTLYDLATGQKLALFEPDEGAFEEVAPLCPRTVFNYDFGLASVQHLERLDEIHLQRCADVERVQALLDSLFAFYEEGAPEPLTEFAADTLCAAKSADENWYRAVIVSASDDAATVQFPDYGNSETVPKAQLRKLDPRFHEPCAQALVAGLGLEALQESALARLAEWTAEQEVQVTLACGADGWLASLHLDGVDLSMRLVDEKLAAPRAAAAAATAPEPTSAPAPPPPGCTQVYISHIDTPGHFWLQPADKVGRIDEIQAELQAHAADYPEPASRELGALCAAKYSADEQWYRAQVLDLDADITTVRFVDYGNTDVLDNRPGVLRELPEVLRSVEPLALRSSVNAVPTGTGQWSEPAADSFAALVGDTSAPVDALVVLKDETTYVDLFVGGENLTDRLVAQGHAARAEQPECGDLPACFASHVNSPAEFWLQLESAAPELQAVEAAMVDAERFPELPSREEGVLCAAKYPEDEAWYRAQVIVDGSEGTEVLFMDYGNASIATELRSLPAELKGRPALSRKCALQKPRDIKAWSRKSEAKFTELAAEGATVFKVQFIASGDVSIVELFLDGRSVTEQLVGLCEERPPPALCPAPEARAGRICHVGAPDELYLHLDAQAADLDSVVERLAGAEHFEPAAELRVGSLCAALWAEDEQWYRARVLEFCDADHHVQFVDYGNKARCDQFRRLPDDVGAVEPLARCCRLAGVDAAAAALAADKLDQYMADDSTFHIEFLDSASEPALVKLLLDGEDITSTLIASKPTEPDNTVNDSTVEVDFTKTSEKTIQDAEATVPFQVETEVSKETDLETIDTDKALIKELDLTDNHTKTVASNSMTVSEGVDSVRSISDSEDISSVFSTAKLSEPENGNVLMETVDFTAPSAVTSQDIEATVPSQMTETDNEKESIPETMETECSETLRKGIDSTNKIDLSVQVAESVEQLTDTDKAMQTDPKVDLATPTSSHNITLVFPASKPSEPINENVSTEEIDLTVTSETNQPTEVAVPSRLSESENLKETLSEMIDTGNTEALLEEMVSIDEMADVHFEKFVALLTNTDKPIETVTTSSITVSMGVDPATLTSNDEDSTSVISASKCSEPESYVFSGESYLSVRPEATNHDTEAAVSSQISETEDLKVTIPESKETDSSEALLEEIDSTNKIDFLSENVEESVAQLTVTDKPTETAATDSITTSKVVDPATLTFKDEDSTSIISASKCSELESVYVLPGESYLSISPEVTTQDTEAAVSSQISETEDLIKVTVPESKETDSSEALLEEIDSTNKIDLLSEIVVESVAQLTDTDKPIETAATDSITTSKGIDPATLTSNDEDGTSVISASKCSEPESVNVSSGESYLSGTHEAPTHDTEAVSCQITETVDSKETILESKETDSSEALLEEIDSRNKIVFLSENSEISEIEDLKATIPEFKETHSTEALLEEMGFLSEKVVKLLAQLTGTDKPIETAATDSITTSKGVDPATLTSNDEDSTLVKFASKCIEPENVNVSSEAVDLSQETEAAMPPRINKTEDLKKTIAETTDTDNSEALQEIDSNKVKSKLLVELVAQLKDTDKPSATEATESIIVSRGLDSPYPTFNTVNISSIFSASKPTEPENVKVSTEVVDFTATSETMNQDTGAAVSQIFKTGDLEETVPGSIETEAYKIDLSVKVVESVALLTGTNKPTETAATGNITVSKIIESATSTDENSSSDFSVSKCSKSGNVNVASEEVEFITTPETTSQNTEAAVPLQISETVDLKENIPETTNTNNYEAVREDVDSTNKIESEQFTELVAQLTDDKAKGIVASDSTTVSKVVCLANDDKISSVFSAFIPAEELDFTVTSKMTSQISEAAVPSQFSETEDLNQTIPQTIDTEKSKVLPEEIDTTYKIDSNNHFTGFVELSETNKPTGTAATDGILILKEVNSAAPCDDENIISVFSVAKPSETENVSLSTENVNDTTDTKGAANPQNSETEDLKETIPVTIGSSCSEGVPKEIETTNETDSNAQIRISVVPPNDTEEPTERVDPDYLTLPEENDGFEDDLYSSDCKLDESWESHDTVFENITLEANSETLDGTSYKTNQPHLTNEDTSPDIFEKSDDTIKTPGRDESKDSVNSDTGYTSSDAPLSKDNSPFRDQPKRNPSSAPATENKLHSDENKTEGQISTETDLIKEELIGVDSSMTNN